MNDELSLRYWYTCKNIPIFLQAQTDLLIILVLVSIGITQHCSHLWTKTFLSCKLCKGLVVNKLLTSIKACYVILSFSPMHRYRRKYTLFPFIV